MVVLSFVLHHVPNDLKPKLVGEARRVSRRTLLVIEDTPRNAFDRWTSNRHGESYRKKIDSTASFVFSQSEWEQFFTREHFEVLESRRLSRLCRDPFQPYARSFFVLRRLREMNDHVAAAPEPAKQPVDGQDRQGRRARYEAAGAQQLERELEGQPEPAELVADG